MESDPIVKGPSSWCSKLLWKRESPEVARGGQSAVVKVGGGRGGDQSWFRLLSILCSLLHACLLP